MLLIETTRNQWPLHIAVDFGWCLGSCCAFISAQRAFFAQDGVPWPPFSFGVCRVFLPKRDAGDLHFYAHLEPPTSTTSSPVSTKEHGSQVTQAR